MRRALALAAVVALLCAALLGHAVAEDEAPPSVRKTLDGVIYEVNEWSASVVGVEPGRASITIRWMVDGKNTYSWIDDLDLFPDVREVSFEAGMKELGFYGLQAFPNLERVSLPAGLVTIQYRAFEGCKTLTNIDIPDSVTNISMHAFEGCEGLTRVRLPKSLDTIEFRAFDNCPNLVEFSIDGANTHFTTDLGVLYSKDKTEIVQAPQGIAGVFTIPDGVQSIAESAFYGCSKLTRFALPASIDEIGNTAFGNCTALEGFAVSDKNLYYAAQNGELVTKNRQTLVAAILVGAERYETPEGVIRLENGALGDNETVKTLVLREGVQWLSYGQISGLRALERLYLPASLLSVENDWSYLNETLKRVEIAEGNKAFFSVDGVVYRRSDNTMCFFPRSYGLSYDVPSFVTSIPEEAFAYNDMLQSVTFPPGLKSIGSGAFLGCTELQRVALPIALESIGEYAFIDCISLAHVTLPPGLLQIGRGAFNNCSAMWEIRLPGSLKTIGEYAFHYAPDDFVIVAEKDTAGYRYAWMNDVMWREPEGGAPARVSLAPDREPAAVVSVSNAGDTVALTDAPGANAKELGRYPSGTTVFVLKEEGDFFRVRVGVTEGYMPAANMYKTDKLTSLVTLVAGRQRTKDELPLGPLRIYETPLPDAKTTPVPDQKILLVLDAVGTWFYVDMDGLRGYVPAQYLVVSRNDRTYDGRMFSVVANPDSKDRLNLRKGPSKTSDSLGKYYNGTQVEVIEYLHDGWAHVRVDGKEGYMMVEFLFAIWDRPEEVSVFGNG